MSTKFIKQQAEQDQAFVEAITRAATKAAVPPSQGTVVDRLA